MSIGCIHVRQKSVSIFVSIVILGETVPIRIRRGSLRSNYPFLEDELIVFFGGLGTKFILFEFADDFTRLTSARFSWCLQRMLEFVKDVLVQHLIIELRYSFNIERVSLDFTLCLIIIASVPIVLTPTRTKGTDHKVLTGFKFVGELTEMGSKGDIRLIGTMHVEDRIGVVIEDLFTQEFQCLVQHILSSSHTSLAR